MDTFSERFGLFCEKIQEKSGITDALRNRKQNS